MIATIIKDLTMKKPTSNKSLLRQYDCCINCRQHTMAADTLDAVLQGLADKHYCMLRGQVFTTKELIDASVFCERVY